jgi:hydrophobic/amphiphilic exporter-1 (mainly G- bacteria), HAE1 family
MFSAFFIKRPIFACVISIVIVILGLVAYTRLPVEQYPDMAPPVVRVEALFPGASAQTIADTVAAPLEQEINGVDNMIYMQSTSSDGRYGLDVSFETGVDIDLSAVLVQNRVNIALARLPEEVRRLGVTTRKQSNSIVGVIAVYPADPEKNPEYDDLYLANFVNIRVKDEMLRITGVGGISIFPAKDYAMRVWLDTQKLKARGLTVGDVNAAIREQNVQVAAGVIGRQPAPQGTDFELVVTTQGRLTDPEKFADIIVKSVGGNIVRVRDIGRVVLESRDYTTVARFNGRPGGIMPVYQLPGGNLTQIAGDMEKLFERLKSDPSWPAGLDGKFFYDSSMFIKASVAEVQKTLIEAFVLVFIVVLVFLQSFRTTMIPALTIPVSLIGTFLFMAAFGFSINMLTLFGLVLAIGIVVDDAIVVVENVERNLALGAASVEEATTSAMSEIFGPVIAITLVLMSVFVPAAALPGITGEMYRQFALTIAASTALSGICALTLAPALCAVLLKKHDPHHKPGGLRRIISWPGRAFNAVFDAITRLYAGLCRLSLRALPVTLLLFIATVLATGWLYQRVPTGFVPEEDLGFVVVSAQLPDGASIERSDAVIARVKEIVSKVDGVEDVTTLSGFSIIDGQGTNFANAWIVLKPWDERTKSGRSVQFIINDLQRSVGAVQEAQFFVFSLPAIRGLGNASGFDMRLLDTTGLGRTVMQQSVGEMLGAANGQPTIAFAFSSFRAGSPQLFVDIDRERALKMNVPLSSVFETLQTALGSAYVNDFNLFGKTFQVNTQAESRFRLRAEDILKLDVRNRAGGMVPLGALASVRDSLGPDRVVRYNLYPSASVQGVPARGRSSGEALATMEAVAKDKLPPGVRAEWTTMAFQEQRAAGQGTVVFALALLLVYLILAAQYESWTAPISVVLSIPLVVIGAMAFLELRGLDNNVFTQIGLVLLVGLGAKNAILIVEFARQNRAAGKSIVDSAVEAARTRLRPILMTSFAFILGVLPLVIAEGAGAASRRALGTAVFGGMVGNTFLGLLFTPALFVLVTWLAESVARLFGRTPGRARGHAAEPAPPQPHAP